MTNIIKKFTYLILSLAFLFPQILLADGMIVPPPNYWMQETDQKAVIFYDKGVETLVLSITFKGDANDFAWVVPVPSKPTVQKGSDQLFTSLQALTAYTQAYPNSLGLGIGALGDTEKRGVTVIETKQIEYYDVTTLSSTDKDSLTKWLNDNGYNYPSSASYILDSYIQNNWFFVAMKINPESLGWSDVSNQLRTGHAVPVALSFETKNIVYPLKISSVVSQEDQDGDVTNINSSVNDPLYEEGKIGDGIYLMKGEKLRFDLKENASYDAGTIELWLKPKWNDDKGTYHNLLTIIDDNNQERVVFRYLRDFTKARYTINFYNDIVSASEVVSPISGEWQHVAIAWQGNKQPSFYINGKEIKAVHYSWKSNYSISNLSAKTVLIGGSLKEDRSLEGVIDEIVVYNKRKTNEEILTDYQKGTEKQFKTSDENTLLLAHFDSNLLEEKNNTNFTFVKPEQILPKGNKIMPLKPTTVTIALYAIADHKKTLSNFTTDWAGWVKKKEIEKWAQNDQGGPWIEPSGDKYFLTKLIRTMSYTEMNEDLFLQDAADNDPVNSWEESESANKETFFIILMIIGGALTLGIAILLIWLNRSKK